MENPLSHHELSPPPSAVIGKTEDGTKTRLLSISDVMLAFKAQDSEGFASLKRFLDGMDAALDAQPDASVLKESSKRTLTSMHLATIAVETGCAQAIQAMGSKKDIASIERFAVAYHAQIQAIGGIEKAQRQAAFLAEQDTQGLPRSEQRLQIAQMLQKFADILSFERPDAHAGIDEFLEVATYTHAHMKNNDHSLPSAQEIQSDAKMQASLKSASDKLDTAASAIKEKHTALLEQAREEVKLLIQKLPTTTITEAQAQPQRVAEPSIGAGKGL